MTEIDKTALRSYGKMQPGKPERNILMTLILGLSFTFFIVVLLILINHDFNF